MIIFMLFAAFRDQLFEIKLIDESHNATLINFDLYNTLLFCVNPFIITLSTYYVLSKIIRVKYPSKCDTDAVHIGAYNHNEQQIVKV